jgi:hypothetical protein
MACLMNDCSFYSPTTFPTAPFSDHGYQTFNELIVKMKLFDLKIANRVIADAPVSVWSDGIPPPPLHVLVCRMPFSLTPTHSSCSLVQRKH